MANPYHPSNFGAAKLPQLPRPAAPTMPGMRAGGLMGAASTMPRLPRPVKPVTSQLAGTGMPKPGRSRIKL